MKKKKKKLKKVVLLDLTLKDVIETLVTYDIKHCIFPHNRMVDITGDNEMMGMADDVRKEILLDIEQGTEEMRDTIIHELLHTLHYRRGDLHGGIKNIEKIVKKETKKVYKKLYGAKS